MQKDRRLYPALAAPHPLPLPTAHRLWEVEKPEAVFRAITKACSGHWERQERVGFCSILTSPPGRCCNKVSRSGHGHPTALHCHWGLLWLCAMQPQHRVVQKDEMLGTQGGRTLGISPLLPHGLPISVREQLTHLSQVWRCLLEVSLLSPWLLQDPNTIFFPVNSPNNAILIMLTNNRHNFPFCFPSRPALRVSSTKAAFVQSLAAALRPPDIPSPPCQAGRRTDGQTDRQLPPPGPLHPVLPSPCGPVASPLCSVALVCLASV